MCVVSCFVPGYFYCVFIGLLTLFWAVGGGVNTVKVPFSIKITCILAIIIKKNSYVASFKTSITSQLTVQTI